MCYTHQYPHLITHSHLANDIHDDYWVRFDVRVHRPKQFQVLTSEFDQDPFHLKIDLDIQQSF